MGWQTCTSCRWCTAQWVVFPSRTSQRGSTSQGPLPCSLTASKTCPTCQKTWRGGPVAWWSCSTGPTSHFICSVLCRQNNTVLLPVGKPTRLVVNGFTFWRVRIWLWMCLNVTMRLFYPNAACIWIKSRKQWNHCILFMRLGWSFIYTKYILCHLLLTIVWLKKW